MRGPRTAFLLAALTATAVAPAQAQLPLPFRLSLEVRPAVASPIGDFSAADPGLAASTGYGGSVGAIVGFGPLDVYGDYTALRFGCGSCADSGLDDQALDAGWEAGVQLGLPFLPLLPVHPWVRGGVIGHQLQLSSDEGEISSPSGSGFSVAVGADVGLPFLGGLDLAPTLGYRSYTAEFDFDTLPSRSTDVSYLTLGLGLVYRF